MSGIASIGGDPSEDYSAGNAAAVAGALGDARDHKISVDSDSTDYMKAALELAQREAAASSAAEGEGEGEGKDAPPSKKGKGGGGKADKKAEPAGDAEEEAVAAPEGGPEEEAAPAPEEPKVDRLTVEYQQKQLHAHYARRKENLERRVEAERRAVAQEKAQIAAIKAAFEKEVADLRQKASEYEGFRRKAAEDPSAFLSEAGVDLRKANEAALIAETPEAKVDALQRKIDLLLAAQENARKENEARAAQEKEREAREAAMAQKRTRDESFSSFVAKSAEEYPELAEYIDVVPTARAEVSHALDQLVASGRVRHEADAARLLNEEARPLVEKIRARYRAAVAGGAPSRPGGTSAKPAVPTAAAAERRGTGPKRAEDYEREALELSRRH